MRIVSGSNGYRGRAMTRRRVMTGGFALIFVSAALIQFGVSPSAAVPVNGVLLGSTPGLRVTEGEAWFPIMSRNAALEAWQAKENAVVTVFEFIRARTYPSPNPMFDANNDGSVRQIWNSRSVPMITLLANGTTGTANCAENIGTGLFDETFIKPWARDLKAFLRGPDGLPNNADDRRAYIRLFPEMNVPAWCYSPSKDGGTANDNPVPYKNAYRHVHDVIVAVLTGSGLLNGGAAFSSSALPTRLQWMWAATFYDGCCVTAEQLYPGPLYVNWVGIDAYNYGTTGSLGWQTASQVIDPMLTRLTNFTSNNPKPFALAEVATVSQGGAKSAWITDYFGWLFTKNIKLVAWWNNPADGGNRDFQIFCPPGEVGCDGGDTTFVYQGTTYEAYGAYKTGVGNSWIKAASATNPRLLTDDQFRGVP